MRIKSIVQLAPVQIGGFTFPFNQFTKIILDRRSANHAKCHLFVFQQKETYGAPGDFAEAIDTPQLLELEAAGMIQIIRFNLKPKTTPKPASKKTSKKKKKKKKDAKFSIKNDVKFSIKNSVKK